jgi:hypothetical protein
MDTKRSGQQVGYIARKRKLQQQATSEQKKDEYSMWLISSGLLNETSASMLEALHKVSSFQKNKDTLDLLNSMKCLLTANPILAQDLALVYQNTMKQTYDKLFRQTPAVVKKKQKT